MTKKEKEQIEEIKDKLTSIYKYDNKNLYNRQFYKLAECVEILRDLLK